MVLYERFMSISVCVLVHILSAGLWGFVNAHAFSLAKGFMFFQMKHTLYNQS